MCLFLLSPPPFFPHGLTLSLWLPAIPSFKLFNGLVLHQTPMLERFFIVSVISLHCLGNNFENDFSCGRCSLCLCPLDSHKETAAKRFFRWKENCGRRLVSDGIKCKVWRAARWMDSEEGGRPYLEFGIPSWPGWL